MIPYEATYINDLKEIDYEATSQIMEREISKSKEFLLSSINQVKTNNKNI